VPLLDLHDIWHSPIKLSADFFLLTKKTASFLRNSCAYPVRLYRGSIPFAIPLKPSPSQAIPDFFGLFSRFRHCRNLSFTHNSLANKMLHCISQRRTLFRIVKNYKQPIV
jgi:hypothetical protein